MIERDNSKRRSLEEAKVNEVLPPCSGADPVGRKGREAEVEGLLGTSLL